MMDKTNERLLKVNLEKQKRYRSENKPVVVKSQPVKPAQPRRANPVRSAVPQARPAVRDAPRTRKVAVPLGGRRKPARKRPQRKRGPVRRKARRARGRAGGFRDHNGGGWHENGKWDPINNQEEHRTSWDLTPQEHEKDWTEKFFDVAPELVSHILPLVLGAGDYTEPDPDILATGEKPKSNSFLACATNGKIGSEVPYMHADGNETRVQHREYIGDVYSTTSAFSTQSFDLNPGMNETNPWFAPIANQFTAYRYLGMTYEFVSEGSEYTNSAGLGYVALATQYNSYAPAFTDKRSMLNSQFADAAKPSKSFTHWIECKPGSVPSTELYIRAGSTPANADKRMYDLGRVTLAVGGNTANSAVIGELWATYDVELLLPKTSDTTGDSLNYSMGTHSGVTNATPWGAGIVSYSANSTFRYVLSANIILFPNSLRGLFNVQMVWSGTAVTFVPPTVTATNCSFSTGDVSAPNSVVGVTAGMWNRTVLLTQDGGFITAGTAGTIPGSAVLTVTMYQVPQAPPTQSGIFDYGGRDRQRSYDEFMKRYNPAQLETPTSKPWDHQEPEEEDDDQDVVVLKETEYFGLQLDLETGAYQVYDTLSMEYNPSVVAISEDIAKRLLMLRSNQEFDNAVKLLIIEHYEFKGVLAKGG